MSVFIGDQILSVLRENAFESQARQLEKLFAELNSDDQQLRSNAAEEIIGRCHIRAYGDLNIRTLNGWVWNTMLEKLGKYARQKSRQ